MSAAVVIAEWLLFVVAAVGFGLIIDGTQRLIRHYLDD
jgi:hypothetical protein